MPSSFSPEGRIASGLKDLDVPSRSFVEIAKAFDVQISQGKFSECLNDRDHFDNTTGEQLLDLLNELRGVRDHFRDAPLDFSRTGKIVTLVVMLRVKKVQDELLAEGVEDGR